MAVQKWQDFIKKELISEEELRRASKKWAQKLPVILLARTCWSSVFCGWGDDYR